MISAIDFQPSQIVCLEHEETRLYAEVIQIVRPRQMCWARPLMLVVPESFSQTHRDQSTLYDMRQGADLLWPSILFRAALDTEVMPLFTYLQASKTQPDSSQMAHQQLQDFVRQVWLAHQNNFIF
ncbi:hypothetical protein [Argonema galeatum]|uniref:hypothetical protein n=1 Tax=Argonema galeatum TaxID=2942762 RepID=UPI002011872A|nr:hypothetical protein [Argonema galeatum]MCL1468436.1 hypothetical protein [Argonema galeatum A003/A1]